MIKAMKYKGKNKRNHYFEGWYYKCVTKDQGFTLSFIPGLSKNDVDPHAFIQVIINDHQTIKTEYIRFDLNHFNYDFQNHSVMIEKNSFSINGFKVSIQSRHFNMSGSIDINHHHPIHTNILSPSIMGFFDYFPLMECNHDVVSMNHRLSGKIAFEDKVIDFDGGKGYIEKDYGRSFPEAYIWLQSNHFKNESTSLMMTYATIPYLGIRFKGFIANLIVNDEEYRFATYNFSRVKILEQSDNHVSLTVKKGRYRLVIDAKNNQTVPLKSPLKGKMIQHIKEGLSGQIHIKLYKKYVLIYEDEGYNAGIEIML